MGKWHENDLVVFGFEDSSTGIPTNNQNTPISLHIDMLHRHMDEEFSNICEK